MDDFDDDDTEVVTVDLFVTKADLVDMSEGTTKETLASMIAIDGGGTTVRVTCGVEKGEEPSRLPGGSLSRATSPDQVWGTESTVTDIVRVELVSPDNEVITPEDTEADAIHDFLDSKRGDKMLTRAAVAAAGW